MGEGGGGGWWKWGGGGGQEQHGLVYMDGTLTPGKNSSSRSPTTSMLDIEREGGVVNITELQPDRLPSYR